MNQYHISLMVCFFLCRVGNQCKKKFSFFFAVPDPSSDQFLVKVSQIIGPHTDIVPLLGIGKHTLATMLLTLSPSTVMLKVHVFTNLTSHHVTIKEDS